ncbi:MAG: cytidine/deoxycytidylate deaminase family protein [Candidatus Schekmanbacteria bacterium]|nr:cytidine/deoxycytidylate deaminase family protein [Candidatus Schekmanbacteria bacterium]
MQVIGWDDYFMQIAHLVSKRSTCLRRQVGAVVVKEKRILATGYNGAPRGMKHCDEAGCIREIMKVPSGERHELCRGLHGEQNAILQAALYGISIKDSVLYTTHQPCVLCVKMIINAGITHIFYSNGYPDELGGKLLQEAGITLTKVLLDKAQAVL